MRLPMETPVLDTRGDFCPLPLLKLKRAAARLADGDALEIWSTDPLAPLDVEAWCLRERRHFEALPDDPAGYQRCRIRIAEPQ